MADPQGWGEAIAAAIGATGGGVVALLKTRTLRPEVQRLAKNIHAVGDVAQASILRVAVVENSVKNINEKLDRIQNTLDDLQKEMRQR